MNMKRFVALLLSLCMVLTVVLPNVSVVFAAEKEDASQSLAISELDGSLFDIDLTSQDASTSDLALDTQIIDPEEEVRVIIVMEGDSIIEEDSAAVLNDETEEKAATLEEDQAAVVAEIEETVFDGESLEITYNYTWLLNGVAASVPYGTIKQIEAVSGVKKVLVQNVYSVCQTEAGTDGVASPMTISDGVMIGRESTWAAGYTGKGMKIAIVDTGIDIDHQNFAALDSDKLTEASATPDTIAAALGSTNASARYNGLSVGDVYHNTKVVYAFNYCDDDLDITHDNDNEGDHGTHVAGIAAANKAEGSDVVGVAPDAQLYVMKVFGKNGGAYDEDILAALEDAMILGADVVNMSLGSSAGFTSDGEEIDAIYNRVSDAGIVLSISAGNSTTMGYSNVWGTDENLTMNPDNAVVGSPGTYANATTVASVENSYYLSEYVSVNDYNMAFSDGADGENAPLSTLAGNTYDIVVVPNVGAAEDYEGLDVAGKIALVQRGTISFSDKCTNADAAGAVACLVYNNVAVSNFGMSLEGCTSTIPCALLSLVDGSYIVAAKAENPDVQITIGEGEALVASSTANQMSDFSSWGVAPDLTLEPDITAPGGNIYSTLDGGKYGLMSGTSMAAPNVAGISALVAQYVKETYGLTGNELHTMVNALLMSTSVPLNYAEGLPYSPRNQGSGIANAFNAVTTGAYLSVDGTAFPKVSLGDDPERTGSYSFSFEVNNFGQKDLFYTLGANAQTEDVDDTYAEYGLYFMSSTPKALAAGAGANSTSMVLTYDVDNDEVAGSHDAYLIYQAAVAGKPADENWADVSFRYNTDGNETVDADDVQAYLNALVGNETDADLTDTVLKVSAGETATVNVGIDLAEADKAYFDTYYENGCYVEGFATLTALNTKGVDLSLPYLAFYGDWCDADIFDWGFYWEDDDEVIYNQYRNVLLTQYPGDAWLPGLNPYVEEEFDPNHISLSPNDDLYADYIDDMYISLLRNAAKLSFTYTDAATGEVYFQDEVDHVSKSYYVPQAGKCIPFVYSLGCEPYKLTDADGDPLPNNTKLVLDIAATIDYEGSEAEHMVFPITVDLEAPTLLSATKLKDLDTGDVTLELTFKDNLSTAVVALLSSNGNTVYAIDGVEDGEPDANGYRNYTVSYDITGMTGKLMVLLGDYAFNESYYGINVGGEGTPYGELVGYQYNFGADTTGWVSFDTDVNGDETQITMDNMNVVCAEYVNGYVFAQTESGRLYGFRYEDMLKDSFDIETAFIAQLENVYQDLAYSYVDGQLYGLCSYEEEWYGETDYVSDIYLINLQGDTDYLDAYEEEWAASRGGLFGLCLACDDEGSLYILGNSLEEVYDEETDETYYETSDAQLWKSTLKASSWGDGYDFSPFAKVGEIGLPADYLQSMTWNHNTETLDWAWFYAQGTKIYSCLVEIDPTVTEEEDGVVYVDTTMLGVLSGETCAIFAPLSAEAAALPQHANVPSMDPDVVGTPVLRDGTVTMNVDSTYTLLYDMSPWYTSHTNVVWSSSNEAVATVDANGVVTAVAEGSVEITVANKDDETKRDTCTIQVAALDLKIEGIISSQSAGVGNASGVCTYEYTMVDGVPTFGTVKKITAPKELNYGLSLATSALGRGSIWASEYGNTGMVYEIDPATGAVKDALQPIDGHMLFGLSYSEVTDKFTGIMNMHLFVDLSLTHAEEEDILNSYDEASNEYTWHNVNMLPYLTAAGGNFVTGENGNGASSEIVFCGVTTIPGGEAYEDTYKDYLGNWAMGGSVNYTPTQTLVLLDNVGRLWYIDEITGMTCETDDWDNVTYTSADGESSLSGSRNGVFAVENETADGTATYSVFYIRELAESPLTEMFRSGTMPRITYHFSDIEYAGKTAEGDPMFALSLYDYWNNGTTNELYLYIPGHETDEMDNETWEPIRTPDRLFSLGDTGNHNIIASIHSVEVTGGVDAPAYASAAAPVNKLVANVYTGDQAR